MPKRGSVVAIGSAPAVAAGEALLGTSGKLSAAQAQPGLETAERRYATLRRRFELQAAARRLLPREHAIQQCLRSPIPGVQWVEMWHVPAPETGRAPRGVLRHLRTCRNPWACPICSSIITERRRKELHELDAEARRRGLRVALVTLTFSHRRYDSLRELLAALLRALNRFTGDRASRALRQRFAIVGYVRALEVTHGELNGWHPHCHLLLYVPQEVPVDELEPALRASWLRCLGAAGLSGNDHAFKLDDTNQAVADYLAKWGHEPSWDEAAELTKQPVKRGRGQHRTPFDLLADYDAGDVRAGELFAEYVQAFRCKQQLTPSHGLYELLRGQEMATDAELLDRTDATAWLLGLLAAEAYRHVPASDAVPELLDTIASGDFDQVAELLRSLGVPAAAIRPAPAVSSATG
jgi:Replication protein